MKLFFAIFLSFFLEAFVNSSSPRVRVEQGELTGTTYTLKNGRTLYAFLGIPYAVPLTHKNRFKPPQPLKPWAGIWNATTYPSSCLQYSHPRYSIEGQEDCLYLNIYTPELPVNGVSPLMDVIVYIHGGAFMFGNGQSVRPDYVLRNQNLVVVTLNYRLGILGFFSSGDSIVPGNNGLKDQVAALKWIHNNIAQFGGNSASVTISGCSAGGASVHYQMLSPMSDGLFQKAISFSGTTLSPWTLPRNNTEKSIQLAAYVGCPTNETRDMVKCLRKRPAKQLVETMKNFMTWRYCPFSPFGPTVEPATGNNFLTEEPVKLLKDGRVKNIPWLTSLLENEGLYPASDFIAQESLLKELRDDWNDIAPHLFMYNFSVSSEEEKTGVSAAIREFYFGNKVIATVNDMIPEIVQALGDRLFYNDIIRAIKLHVASTKTTNAYCYKFSYRGKYSLTNTYSKTDIDFGASHSDDIYYLFKVIHNLDETPNDVAVSELMCAIIATFAKTGNPVLNANMRWEPISANLKDNVRCLWIKHPDEMPVMMEYDNQSTSEFWRKLLPSEDSSVTDYKDEL